MEREKGEDADIFKDTVLEDDSLHSVPSSQWDLASIQYTKGCDL